MTGLLANLPRVRARAILDLRRAVVLALEPRDMGLDVLRAAGMGQEDLAAVASEHYRAQRRAPDQEGEPWP